MTIIHWYLDMCFTSAKTHLQFKNKLTKYKISIQILIIKKFKNMEVYDTEYKTVDVGRVNQGYKHGFFL